MSVEAKLCSLCKDFIELLELLKERECITQEEFNIMAEQKLKFIESRDNVCLKI